MVFLFIIIGTVTSVLLVSALEITEVELNPPGDDAGNEWVELYSLDKVNLEGYYLINGDGDVYNLTGIIEEEYLVIKFPKQWLDNIDETVTLFNNESILMTTPPLKDNKNNGLTQSYCGDTWILKEGSPSADNDCPEEDNNQTDSEENSTYDQNDQSSNDENQSTDEGTNQENEDNQTFNDLLNYTEENANTNESRNEQLLSGTREKITLNDASEKIDMKKSYSTNDGLFRTSLIYVFAGLCMFVLVLFAMNKLK